VITDDVRIGLMAMTAFTTGTAAQPDSVIRCLQDILVRGIPPVDGRWAYRLTMYSRFEV
jgi:hypothetical protein